MLIVDLHKADGKQRILDLTEALTMVTDALADAVPSYAEQVYGETRSPEPELECVQAECRQAVQNKRLVLLHCGGSQHCVPDVLDLVPFKSIPCLLYSGGTPDAEITQFVRDRSSRCALIPEVLPLAGLDQGQKERLESTVRLILREGKEPGVAVAMAYGDPDLEKILDRLYGKLVSGADLNRLRVERDAELEEHYRKRRGW
jgi:hypothetical protein